MYRKLDLPLLLLLALGLLAGVVGLAQEPVLPAWDPRSPANTEPSGAALIPFLPPPPAEQEADAVLLRPTQPLSMMDDGLHLDDLHLFLPLRSGRQSRPPLVAPSPLRELPALYVESLRHWPEHSHLMDPQTLLTEVPRQELQRLLSFHARESRSRLYLLVLDQDQTLPAALAPEALAGGFVAGDYAALIVCPMGETWRSRFFLGGRLRQYIPPTFLREMIRDCVNDSQQARESDEQLQRLAVRASTWLFRLESHFPTLKPAPLKNGILHEVGEGRDTPSPTPNLGISLNKLPSLSGILIIILAVILTGICGYFLKRRLRQRAVCHAWMIEECEAHPRLGGAFCGGSGARLMPDGKIVSS